MHKRKHHGRLKQEWSSFDDDLKFADWYPRILPTHQVMLLWYPRIPPAVQRLIYFPRVDLYICKT